MTAPAARTTHPDEMDALVQAARALGPMLRAASEEIERERGLPAHILQALKAAGAFRMPMPRAWGGPEADPLTQIRVVEALAEADASAAWCVMIGSDSGYFSAFMDEQTARTMYDDLDTISAGQPAPKGRAQAVPGGYTVTGGWSFGSGIGHSDTVVAGCVVYDGESPRRGADGAPQALVVVVPRASVEIIDTWYTTGLRGSGSHDFAINRVFVPEERTWSFVHTPLTRSEPLYRHRAMFTLNVAGVPLGVARGAIDELIALAGIPPRDPASPRLRDEAHAQRAVAEAEALLGSARAYTFDVIGDLWRTLLAGDGLTPLQAAKSRLMLTHVHAACLQAVELVYHTAGPHAVYAGRLDRALRDLQTINQHVIVSPKSYEAAGKALFGEG